MQEYLSPHFSKDEFLFSETAQQLGILNTPDDEQLEHLYRLANAQEEVRDLLGGVAILTNSAFRIYELNVHKDIGSSPNSQHILGGAHDFRSPRYGTPREIYEAIKASTIEYDQLIFEYSWVHRSIPLPGIRPRKEAFEIDTREKR